MISFQINNRKIVVGESCFIVAEAGVNHNGSLVLAKKLIDIAADAGVDAVKFQVLTARGLYVPDAGRTNTSSGEEVDIYKVWENVEVPYSWIPELKDYCDKKGILFFCSVFDELSVEKLNPYIPIYKIASSELTHIPLLKKVALTGKPIIISIGSASMDEVLAAIDVINKNGNSSVAILYCVQKYPTPLRLANVKAIETLKKEFPSLIIGYRTK